MRIHLREYGAGAGGRTFTVRTLDVPDAAVADLLGVLIPFARMYAAPGSVSPTRGERRSVAQALEQAGIIDSGAPAR